MHYVEPTQCDGWCLPDFDPLILQQNYSRSLRRVCAHGAGLTCFALSSHLCRSLGISCCGTGFAFCDYQTKEMADACVKGLDGHRMENIPLTVEIARRCGLSVGRYHSKYNVFHMLTGVPRFSSPVFGMSEIV